MIQQQLLKRAKKANKFKYKELILVILEQWIKTSPLITMTTKWKAKKENKAKKKVKETRKT
jgi:hypothetical protein